MDTINDLPLRSEITPTIIRQWIAKDGMCYWFLFETRRQLNKSGLRIRINVRGKPVLARKKVHFQYAPSVTHVERRFIHPVKGEVNHE